MSIIWRYDDDDDDASFDLTAKTTNQNNLPRTGCIPSHRSMPSKSRCQSVEDNESIRKDNKQTLGHRLSNTKRQKTSQWYCHKKRKKKYVGSNGWCRATVLDTQGIDLTKDYANIDSPTDPCYSERSIHLVGFRILGCDFGRRMICSVILGAAIGLERKASEQFTGIRPLLWFEFRTMSLVCFGSSWYTTLSRQFASRSSTHGLRFIRFAWVRVFQQEWDWGGRNSFGKKARVKRGLVKGIMCMVSQLRLLCVGRWCW